MRLFSALFFLFGFSFPGVSQVVFKLSALPERFTPEMDTLFLAGNFNNWNPRDAGHRFRKNPSGEWEVRVNNPVANLQYKVTRGSWATVEVGPSGQDIANRTSSNTPGSTVSIPVADWADTRGNHTANANVRILTSQLWLPTLQRFRRIWVCLPGSYAADTTRRFPVMYFHDGQNVFDAATSFAGEWKVDEALQQLEVLPGWGPVIAVGIDNGGGERISELTPFRHPNYGGGNGEAYAQDLAFTVKALIDSRFRTLPGPSQTGVAGSSLGGIISLFTAYQYPEIFGKALVFSPSLWFSDSLRQFCLSRPQPVNSRLYWLCGTNEGDPDMVPDMNQCFDDLLAAGMPSAFMQKSIITGGTHSEGFWSQWVKTGVQWLFASPTRVRRDIEPEPAIQIRTVGHRWEISLSEGGPETGIRVYDQNGRQVWETSSSREMPVSISKEGIYWIRWDSPEGVKTQAFLLR